MAVKSGNNSLLFIREDAALTAKDALMDFNNSDFLATLWLTGIAIHRMADMSKDPTPVVQQQTHTSPHSMKSILRSSVGTLVVGMLFASIGNVSAITTMADLLAGGTFTSCNLVFYGFSNFTQTGDLTVTTSDIGIAAVISGGDSGIRFQSAMWSLTGSNQNYDLAFDFKVTTVSTLPVIEGNTLTIIGSATGPGHAQLAETVQTLGLGSLAGEFVYVNQVGTGADFLSDHQTFAGYPPTAQTAVFVQKDLALTTTGSDPAASIFVSHFDQYFSVVPEPCSSVLFGLGMAGLLVRRRRA